MYVLLLVLVMIGLSACSGKSVSEDLQEGKWNIVSTSGESYTGEFGEDTVTFKLGSFNRGFTYTMEGEEIHMVEGSEEPVIFEVEKKEDEYSFKAKTDEVFEIYGDLTLSPSK